MLTKNEIRTKYKTQHDPQSKLFYDKKHSTGGATEEETSAFLAWHNQLRKDEEAEIKTASDYVEPVPPRDLAKEIDDLRAKIDKLKSPL